MGRADLGRPGSHCQSGDGGCGGRLSPAPGSPPIRARCRARVCGRPRAGGGLAPLRGWADRGPARPRRLPRPRRAPPRAPRPRLGRTAPARGSGGSTGAAAGVRGGTLPAPLGDDHGQRPGRPTCGVSALRAGPRGPWPGRVGTGGGGRGPGGGAGPGLPSGPQCGFQPLPPGATAAAGEREGGWAGKVEAPGTLGRSLPSGSQLCRKLWPQPRQSFLPPCWRLHLSPPSSPPLQVRDLSQ